MKTMPRVFLGAIAAGFLTILSGCPNPAQQPESADTGTLSLTIGGQRAVRTIAPATPAFFYRFDLAFAPVAGCNAGNTGFSESWTGDSSGTIELDVGTWDLSVTAFLPGGAAAEGSLSGIEIHPRGTIVGNVALSPIPGGTGTFSWNIGFDSARIPTARMVITQIEGNTGAYWGTYYFAGGTVAPTANPGSLDLPVGQYRVAFTLINNDGEEAVLTSALHIFRSMTSNFTEVFTEDHFLVSLEEIVFASWDGTMWRLAEDEITARHFYLLGISGVYDGNFGAVVGWLNNPHVTAAVYDGLGLTGLRVLVDAALIGIGSTYGGLFAGNYNRNDAQEAIVRLTGNDTDIAFAWAGDGTVTASVRVGASDVAIAFVVPMRSAPGGTLAARLGWLRNNAQSGNQYLVEIDRNEILALAQSALPTGRNNLTIILRGTVTERTVSLSENGNLFAIEPGVTLVLCENVTLQGHPANNNALVYVSGGGTLIMNEGSRITGNTSAANNSGGGVLVGGGAAFAMHGGVISGNTATGNNGGGGVFVANGGIFQTSGGVVYGTESRYVERRNTATSNNSFAVLRNEGTTQFGAFNAAGMFVSLGALGHRNLSIRVIDGILLFPAIPECDLYHTGDGRSCIAQFKNLFGNGVVLGDRLPSGYANWGTWVEARITAAIRNAELEVIRELGYDVNWFADRRFPVILVPGGGMGDGRGMDTVAKPPGAERHPMIAGNIMPNMVQDSFAEDCNMLLGSAMIIHEEFISRGRHMHEMPDCDFGFPCLTLESIERAIEFHRIAMRNMHDVDYYYVNGDNLRMHNVFSHFDNFVTSPRFTNNITNLPFGFLGSIMGLQFNPDGFPAGYNLPTSENRDNQPWVWPRPNVRLVTQRCQSGHATVSVMKNRGH